MKLAVFLTGLVVAASVMLGGGAEAARKPSQSCQYVDNGTTISVSGSGFAPNRGVAIRWEHGVATTFFWAATDASGAFSRESPDGGAGATVSVKASDISVRRERETECTNT